MALIGNEKQVRDVLNGIKRNKKILSVVEEILVLAKMVDIGFSGTVSGYSLFDYDENNKSEVAYDLRFYSDKHDRKLDKRITFFYRNNKIHRVETFIYPFDYKKQSEMNKVIELLNTFKNNLVEVDCL
jgi:hypothetical protein